MKTIMKTTIKILNSNTKSSNMKINHLVPMIQNHFLQIVLFMFVILRIRRHKNNSPFKVRMPKRDNRYKKIKGYFNTMKRKDNQDIPAHQTSEIHMDRISNDSFSHKKNDPLLPKNRLQSVDIDGSSTGIEFDFDEIVASGHLMMLHDYGSEEKVEEVLTASRSRLMEKLNQINL